MPAYTKNISEMIRLRERINVRKNNNPISMVLESDKVFMDLKRVTKATLFAEGENLENLTFYLSADDGDNWQQVELGKEVSFVNNGLVLFNSERAESGDNQEREITNQNFYAQTFTIGSNGPNRDFLLDRIDLRLYRVGSPTNLCVCLTARRTDNNFPLLPPLVILRIPGSNIPTTASWVSFSFLEKNFILHSGKAYTIMCYVEGSGGIRWRVNTNNPYPGGNLCASTNRGNDWTAETNTDAMFRVFGRTLPALKYKVVGSNAVLKNVRISYVTES